MEDKKNLFVIIFITFFVMVYVQWMFPQAPQKQAEPLATANVQNQIQPALPNGSVASPATQGVNGQIESSNVVSAPSLSQLKNHPQTVVNTGVSLITINHLGARVQSVKLKNHTTTVDDKTPFEMISIADGLSLPLGVKAEGTTDDFTLYTLKTDNLPVLEGPSYIVDREPLVLEFEGTLTSGALISKKIIFKPNSYAFDVKVALDRPTADGSAVVLQWTHAMTPEKLEAEKHSRKFSVLNSENKLSGDFLSAVKEGFLPNKLAQWAAINDFYFIDAVVSSNGAISIQEGRIGDNFFINAYGKSNGADFTIFSGPKEIELLRAVGFSLDRSVDLGWFSFLAHPILAVLRFFYSLIGNYGISIILLTLLIKLGFLPLTQASFKSMKAMQELQPEVAALRERVKDPNVLNQELMMLYKKRGVNPLGGCLPIFIQIPVFLGLYNALLNSIELRHEPFALWINDLSSPEKLEVFGIGIPLMILMMGASMFWQQKTTPSTLDPQQQKIMLFMPVIFTGMFILHPMPSGLVLYWLVNNTISIVQQVFIRGHKSAVSPLMATAYASLGILIFGYVLTKI